MQSYFEQLGLSNSIYYAKNGQEVIEIVKAELSNAIQIVKMAD